MRVWNVRMKGVWVSSSTSRSAAAAAASATSAAAAASARTAAAGTHATAWNGAGVERSFAFGRLHQDHKLAQGEGMFSFEVFPMHSEGDAPDALICDVLNHHRDHAEHGRKLGVDGVGPGQGAFVFCGAKQLALEL